MANTRTLKGKTKELFAETYGYDIVCLTEIHIDFTILNHQIFDCNKSIYRKDRTLHGDGVLIAIIEDLNCSFFDFHNDNNTELVIVKSDSLVSWLKCPPTRKD